MDGRKWLEAIANKGEMLVMWVVEYGNQSITCKLCEVNQELTWFLTTVYASCDRNEMMELWKELGAMGALGSMWGFQFYN